MKRHPLPSRPPGMRTFQLKTPVELARRIDAPCCRARDGPRQNR